MLKIIFYLRAEKANKSGECPIFAKITYRQQSMTISTGKFISQERWNTTNKLRHVLKLDKEKILKKSLDLLALDIEKKFIELLKIDLDASLIQLKNKINGKSVTHKTKSMGLIEIFKKHNSDFALKVNAGERSSASLQKYERSKELVKKFILKHYGLKDLPISEVNSAFVFNLESYLKYESSFKGKVGIKNNSVVKYFKNFITVCNHAIKLELIEKNPFTKYDGKLQIKDAIFLTQSELNSIESKIFKTERLERVKNIFLFSCYTGYAPVDACSLTEENLIKDGNGNLWIKTNRAKTSIKANVPVLSPALKIIEKYRDNQQGLIPKLSNQKMNAYLKEIADLCGISKNLTWYVARHTFATTVTLGNGIRIENVSAMLGHTNIKQTQHYAKVLDQNVMDDMEKIMSKYQ